MACWLTTAVKSPNGRSGLERMTVLSQIVELRHGE